MTLRRRTDNDTGSRRHKVATAVLALCAFGVSGGLAAETYNITSTATPGGSIAPGGSIVIAAHSDVTVAITGNGEYHISDVLVDGNSVGPVPSFTFVDVTTNHTLEASFHIPWATGVVSYTVGTNSWVQPNVHWQHADTATGQPSRTTDYGWRDVTMFEQPWMTNEIVSIGAGGELTVTFDHPILNDPLNLYGIDLLVFGNAMFTLTGGRAGAPHSEPGMVSVSQDGETWHHIPSAAADSLFPTLGFTDTPAAQDSTGGTTPTSFVQPVNPAINWQNATYAQLVSLYDGAGGGAGVDIGEAGLDWIRYVRVWQPANDTWSTEVDAFADVAPSLDRRLTISSPYPDCIPTTGSHIFTSGNAVTCTVTDASSNIAQGTRAICNGWTGSGSVPVSGTGITARFTITSPSSLQWNWETQHWVAASCSAGGNVSTTGTWVNAGQELIITANPSNGSVFAGWTGDTAGDTNSPVMVLPSDGPRTITALFSAAPAVPAEIVTWLDIYGLTNVDAWAELGSDRDGDGHTGQEEYEAGTDPTRRESVLRIIEWHHTGTSNTLTWLGGPHGSDAPFSAWYATNVTGPWNLIGNAFEKSLSGTNKLGHIPPQANAVFYRITVTAGDETP